MPLGHLWTIGPHLARGLKPPSAPRGELLRVPLDEPGAQLSGWLHHPRGARQLVVIVHGLGGDAGSSYMLAAAGAATRAGHASLRLNLRGADGDGRDYYHAGLTRDLRAVLAHDELSGFERVVVLGFSLGGHMVLRAATEVGLDERVARVAAVCSPLDLSASARAFDEPSRVVYRRYVLDALKKSYAEVARHREVPLEPRLAARIGTIVEWDDRVVAPRHGFASAADYYARVSVAPRLPELGVPALYVGAPLDPMVPEHTVRPALRRTAPLEVRWVQRGGHVGFPPRLDLGLPGPRGLEPQVVSWLSAV